MASVRILHASDLHIAAAPNIYSPVDRPTPGTIVRGLRNRTLASSYDPSILLHLAKFAYTQASTDKLDAVLLTGDISTTGSIEDLEKAREFIQDPVEPGLGWQNKFGEARLRDLKAPVWILPGNHDRYMTTPIPFSPGGDSFDRIFNAEWQGPGKKYQPIKKAGLTVTVIAADFCLRTWLESDGMTGWIGQGKVHADEGDILDQLEDATGALEADERQCVIWAVHFPPAYPRVPRNLELLNSELLIQRANRCGVKAVLAGHTHEALKYRRANMKFDVFCAGTASQAFAPEGNHFRIIEISTDALGNAIVQSDEYRFNKVSGGIIRDRSGFIKL